MLGSHCVRREVQCAALTNGVRTSVRVHRNVLRVIVILVGAVWLLQAELATKDNLRVLDRLILRRERKLELL